MHLRGPISTRICTRRITTTMKIRGLGGLAIWDEQAGHTAWVSGMIYSRLAGEGLAGIEVK